MHAPVIEAQREYQRLMAESHIAFLQATAASYARLTGTAVVPRPARLRIERRSCYRRACPTAGAGCGTHSSHRRRSAAAGPEGGTGRLVPLVLAVVAEKTGYPVEMIELTMDLESDLGIDSIKRVEILAAVRERAPGLPPLDAARMATLRTLGEIAASLGSSPAA